MVAGERLRAIRTRPVDRRIAFSFLVALCALGPLLAACGQSAAPNPSVSLLPDPSANGQTWGWSAQCQSGPYAHKRCAASGPDLGSAQLNGDEWNLGEGMSPGKVDMSVSSPGGLEVRGDFASTPPCTEVSCIAPSANTWVRAYPNVLYGINQCHAATSPPQSRNLPLPIEVAKIPSDLIGTTQYSLQLTKVTYDIAYDMWLNPSDTKKPCRNNGTLEVMIWTGYDQKALLPASMQLTTATIPYARNGIVRAGTQAWSIYVSNVYGNDQTAPWGGAVFVVLNGEDIVNQGTVSVDISSVLSAVGGLLQEDFHWSDFSRRYWLDTIPFGMEFGPQSGTLSGTDPTHFLLRLASYCLNVATTLSHVLLAVEHLSSTARRASPHQRSHRTGSPIAT